jgi:hypothetical protein
VLRPEEVYGGAEALAADDSLTRSKILRPKYVSPAQIPLPTQSEILARLENPSCSLLEHALLANMSVERARCRLILIHSFHPDGALGILSRIAAKNPRPISGSF